MIVGWIGVLDGVLGDEGGGPQGRGNLPWQVMAWAAVGLVVLVVITAIVLWRLGRRPGRLSLWRQKRLQLEEAMLGRGPRQALVHLRLQLDQAVGLAKSAVGTEAADIGDLRLLVTQLQTAAARVARQIDALLQSGAGIVPSRTVDALRARVREIEAAAASISDAATSAVTGATAVEIEDLSRGVRDLLQLVDARTEAWRELSGRDTNAHPPTNDDNRPP